jgi:hypothetical protein
MYMRLICVNHKAEKVFNTWLSKDNDPIATSRWYE